MRESMLGGMPVARFLRDHWQKRPLLVRQVMPRVEGLLSVDALFALAARDDVESRLVVRERGRWTLAHGPFGRSDRRALPSRNWTLLVQGVNLHVAAADVLLRRFDFLPYARLDDLMVSYAAPGGGVGPHFDSYDVFLLQGFGRRLWRTSRQRDLTLTPRMPLKILARFRPQSSSLLAPGDMLYLPPRIAHDGIAIDACTTYSIGFRAPAAQELAVAFLDWLRDRLELEGRYEDRDLAPTTEPARVSRAMRTKAAALLRGIRWDARAIDRFLGTYLTEPKPTVHFERPARPLAAAAFRQAAARRGLRLDARAQLLYDERHLFMNGEATAWPRRGAGVLRKLANARALSGKELRLATPFAFLYPWYRDGFLRFP
ncbi:MAG TPA: cupin domain-containing protein [Casimicrobiaceae bacterium]